MESSSGNVKYTIEDILEMLSGNQYYDDDTIKFIYNKVNGNKMEADFYLEKCLSKAAKLCEIENKMKDESEIKTIEEALTKAEEINDDDDK